MSVKIPEVKGSFKRLYDLICTFNALWKCAQQLQTGLTSSLFTSVPRNVTEFTYRMSSQHDNVAQICMSIQTKTPEEFTEFVASINSQDGMHVADLSENELAKSHLRHLVGGRAADVRFSRGLACLQPAGS